jgi:hypothetical protein
VKDVGNLVKDEVLDLYLVVDCSECGEMVLELWDGSVQDAGISQTCATGLFWQARSNVSHAVGKVRR